MAKPQLHGLRHGQKITISSYGTGERLDIEYKADTKSDPSWVIVKDCFGDPVGRQAKQPAGAFFPQGQVESRDGYPCEFYSESRGWTSWSDSAPKGEIKRMLQRVLA